TTSSETYKANVRRRTGDGERGGTKVGETWERVQRGLADAFPSCHDLGDWCVSHLTTRRITSVSRDFKYKTAQALADDAKARGLSVRLQSDLSPLTEPITIGGRRLGNRLAIHPMEGCDGTLDGAPDELTLRRYVRFGAGGAKLVWGEAAAVVPE